MTTLRRAVIAIACAAVACSRSAPSPAVRADNTGAAIAPADTPPQRTPAAPMSYLGADWLDRADREATEQPERVLDALHLRPGDRVADVGAGTGYFALRIARRVGPSGHVFATDIQPEMLSILRERAAAAHATQIETVLATEDDARLAPQSIDLALMVDVYHELAHPIETLAQIQRALRDGGRIVLVEYRGEDPAVPIKPEHKMTLEQIRAEVEAPYRGGAALFRFETSHEFLPTQRVVVFRRAP